MTNMGLALEKHGAAGDVKLAETEAVKGGCEPEEREEKCDVRVLAMEDPCKHVTSRFCLQNGCFSFNVSVGGEKQHAAAVMHCRDGFTSGFHSGFQNLHWS